MNTVAVIGAGLSGLACAAELKKNAIDVEVFEAQDQVGGRVKTDKLDGFLLDQGFQVYLNSYQMGRYYFDEAGLGLGAFRAGAKIFSRGRFYSLIDPLRHPEYLLTSAFSPLTTIKDKFLTLQLRKECSDILQPKQLGLSYPQFLQNYGFSRGYIDRFFRPFFRGVFLDPQEAVDAGYFCFIFGRFASGYACLPRKGMQDLAEQMQRRFALTVHCQKAAEQLIDKEILFADGQRRKFAAIILACEPETQAKLLGRSSGLGAKPMAYHSTRVYYFQTRSSTFAEDILWLNADGGPIGHIACLSAAQPSYAPAGLHLFSVSVHGETMAQEDFPSIRMQLQKILGEAELSQWQDLRSYYVAKALPASCEFGTGEESSGDVICTGDYRESPSIDGALKAGQKAAYRCLERLRGV